MRPLAAGSLAPEVAGAPAGTRALVFYKVTCPVCQMAAPKLEQLESAYPGRTISIGQDPDPDLDAFATEHGMHSVPHQSEPPPYELSNSYGVRVVPTLFLIDDLGAIVDVMESWDRDVFNRVSAKLAAMIGASEVVVSDGSDGLPVFRPG